MGAPRWRQACAGEATPGRRSRADRAPGRRRGGDGGAPRVLHPRAPGAGGAGRCGDGAGGGASGSASRRPCSASAASQARTKGVPTSRARNRCALDRDIPAARAARETQPVSSRQARKIRCRAGVQQARSGRGGGGEAADVCSIDQRRSDKIQHLKGVLFFHRHRVLRRRPEPWRPRPPAGHRSGLRRSTGRVGSAGNQPVPARDGSILTLDNTLSK
jgi:hypothetical protein